MIIILPTASEQVCDLLNSSEQHYVQLKCCCVIFTTVMIINSSFSIHISIVLVTNVTNQRFSLQSQRLRSSPSTVNWLTKPNDSFKGKSAASLQRSRPTGKGSVRACTLKHKVWFVQLDVVFSLVANRTNDGPEVSFISVNMETVMCRDEWPWVAAITAL